MNEPNPITKLKELPLELREAIYYESTDPLEVLEPPAKLSGNLLGYLHSQLPEDFQNDAQIASEATTALLRRALQTATTIKVPGPEFLQPAQSMNIEWSSVHRLEFTEIQMAYARSGDDSATGLTVHDIVSRCPNLEVLAFVVRHDTLLESQDQKAGEVDSHELAPFGNVLRVTEHPNIQRLELGCRMKYWSFNRDIEDRLSTKEYEPFVEAFEGESRACGRDIKLVVDFSPGWVASVCEEIRCHKGVFTWGERQCWFG